MGIVLAVPPARFGNALRSLKNEKAGLFIEAFENRARAHLKGFLHLSPGHPQAEAHA